VVDTEMQATLRALHAKDAMGSEAQQAFLDLHAQGKLLNPALPAKAIGELAINAEMQQSGEFIDWSSVN
jgi:hypothetical protein